MSTESDSMELERQIQALEPELPLLEAALKDERANVDRREAERSLLKFTKGGWPEVEPVPFVDNWHIHCLCDHLQAIANQEILRLLVNVPPIYCWFYALTESLAKRTHVRTSDCSALVIELALSCRPRRSRATASPHRSPIAGPMRVIETMPI